jgi:hypothetical protein
MCDSEKKRTKFAQSLSSLKENEPVLSKQHRILSKTTRDSPKRGDIKTITANYFQKYLTSKRKITFAFWS